MVLSKRKRRSPNWGGARENAGRKSGWNNQETCTIRIPKVFAPKLREIARQWDKGQDFDLEIKSNLEKYEFVSDSSIHKFETDTKSSPSELDKITKSNTELTEAINLAKKILKHNKSAKISLARFLSRLYNVSVKVEDLN
jgi:hypothetical protein